jgi:cytochrome c oxidase assembly protein subunit 15
VSTQAHAGRLARLRSYEVTPARFRKVAVAALVWIYLVVTTGAIVRLTGSGLGCDHWPNCGNTPFPQKGGHAAIEFGNRVIGAITIVFALVAWLAARRACSRGLPRWVTRLTLVVFLGTAAQIPLGGLTVIFHLNPGLVMSHFLLALVMLGIAVVVVIAAIAWERGVSPPLVPRELRLGGLALVASSLALVVSGAFATAAGPHAGDSSKVARLGTPAASIAGHAAVTAIFGLTFFFVLGYLFAGRRRWPRLFLAGLVVLAGLLVQVGIGELQYRTGVPWGLVLFHVALASAVWAATVALVVLLWRPPAFIARP